MGYDMYINAELTEAEALAKDAAEQLRNDAVKARDALPAERRNTPEWEAAQQKVMDAFDHASTFDLNYFRLNIWGMGRCRGYMEERGMIYHTSSADAGEWPDYEEPEQAEGEDTDAWYARIDEYDEAHSQRTAPLRSFHPEGGDTIPSHKFGSNDGWLVTEDECKAAATVNALADPPTFMDEDGETKPVEWWPEWIAFLERAATHGGFRVH
jgi:hypothetical protein